MTKVCVTGKSFYTFWGELQATCRRVWIPSEIVNIDETLLRYLGWFWHHFGIIGKPARNGIKLIGLFDSLGWFYGWSLCKRKTLDGRYLDTDPLQNIVGRLVKLLPTTKKYHLFMDSWFNSEASLIEVTNMGHEVTGSVNSLRMGPLWRKLDKDLDERRTLDKSVKSSAATGTLANGKDFWAVSTISGRKKDVGSKKPKHLHYISTHTNGSKIVNSMKTDVDDDLKKVQVNHTHAHTHTLSLVCVYRCV